MPLNTDVLAVVSAICRTDGIDPESRTQLVEAATACLGNQPDIESICSKVQIHGICCVLLFVLLTWNMHPHDRVLYSMAYVCTHDTYLIHMCFACLDPRE